MILKSQPLPMLLSSIPSTSPNILKLSVSERKETSNSFKTLWKPSPPSLVDLKMKEKKMKLKKMSKRLKMTGRTPWLDLIEEARTELKEPNKL